MIKHIIYSVTVLLFLQTQVSAATFFVTNGNDSGTDSFRKAIEDSNVMPGEDIIQFAPDIGVFLFAVLPDINDDLIIRGNNSTIFAPQNSGILTTFKSIYIEELTFRDAVKSIFGGALAVRGLSDLVTIKDCKFINNRSSSIGGAIYCSSATGEVIIENCMFNVNVGSIGGAISFLGEKLTITNTQFNDNGAAFGNAIQHLRNELIFTGDYFATPTNDIAIESLSSGNPVVILAAGFNMLPGSELYIRKI